jgi:hypothetical protein
MYSKDSFLTVSYKDGFIHTCRDINSGKEIVQSQIGYEWKTHNTIIGAKRYISTTMHYRHS